MQKIGIIGGAGPRAGALMFRKIIDEYSKKGAWQDREFPFIVLLSIPFMPMMDDNENELIIKEQLQEAIDQLSSLGVTDCVIACNTLHGYLLDLDFKGINFHSLIECTLGYLAAHGYEKVVIAATRATKKNDLYNDPRCEYTDSLLSDRISHYIVMVLQQKDTIAAAHEFAGFIEGINAPVVLGCTELSVLNADYELFQDKMVVDPLDCVLRSLMGEL